jgi:hypothetical protein
MRDPLAGVNAELLLRHMSASISARIRGITTLAGVLGGLAVASGARAESAELAPIDPFCPSSGLSECVLQEIDPGIYLREAESNPWDATIEVGYSNALVCDLVISLPPGCIDVNELSRIVPNIELPGDRR